MDGISIDYRLDMAQAAKRFNAVIQDDGLELLDQVGDQVLMATLLRFDAEETPEGEPWQPSHRAESEGGKTLQDRGHLRDSYTYQVTGDSVEIGSAMIYAAIHHEGGVIQAKNSNKLKFKVGDHWVQVDQVEIPARPALGISTEDEAEIEEIVHNYIQELLNGY